MRITSASPQKMEKYENKVRLIDRHILKTSKLQENNDVDMVFKLLALNFVPDPPQELQLFVPKIVLFEDKKPRRFLFREHPG